jgi:HEAT repeat protein
MNDRGHVRGRIVKCAVGGVLVLGVLMLAEIAFTQEQVPATLKEMLEAKDRRVQKKAIQQILDDRLRTVNMLIEIVDQANARRLPANAGRAAAYLLGRLRAPEAVPVLSRALTNVDPNGVLFHTDIFTDAEWVALLEIGRPAVPAMIKNITSSDDERLRQRSLGVISRVLGGKDNLIGLLNRLMEQKERSKEEKDRLAKSIEWAQSHYTETKKPLF